MRKICGGGNYASKYGICCRDHNVSRWQCQNNRTSKLSRKFYNKTHVQNATISCTVLKQFTVVAKLQIYQKITPGKNSLYCTNLVTSPVINAHSFFTLNTAICSTDAFQSSQSQKSHVTSQYMFVSRHGVRVIVQNFQKTMTREPRSHIIFTLSSNIWIYSPAADLFNLSVDWSTTDMCHVKIIETSQVSFQKFKNLKKKLKF